MMATMKIPTEDMLFSYGKISGREYDQHAKPEVELYDIEK